MYDHQVNDSKSNEIERGEEVEKVSLEARLQCTRAINEIWWEQLRRYINDRSKDLFTWNSSNIKHGRLCNFDKIKHHSSSISQSKIPIREEVLNDAYSILIINHAW